MNLMHFLRCLNLTMRDTDINTGSRILDTYIPLDVFAINNFGKLDPYFENLENFTILDIDIHDAVPAPEIRMFGLNNQVYINPMFPPDSAIVPGEFIESVVNEIEMQTGSTTT